MAAAGRAAASAPDPEAVAAELRAAAFVRVHGAATGEGLAATGQVVRALDAAGVPYQAELGPLGATVDDAPDPGATGEMDADETHEGDDRRLTVGRPGARRDLGLPADRSPSAAAYDVAAALAPAAADPVLALAGLVATDDASPSDRDDLVEAAGVERRPGLGIPVADLADGVAFSTLVHVDGSGDPDAVPDRLPVLEARAEPLSPGAIDEDTGRARAEALALSVAAAGGPARAAEVVERLLHPAVGGPFETVPGYADVLVALAARAPGLGLQVAMQGDSLAADRRDEALEHWRAHGEATHAAVRAADPKRYDGLVVVETERDPTPATARLLRDFVAPEPVVVILGPDTVRATTRGDEGAFAAAVEAATEAVDGRVVTAGRHARARLDEPARFVDSLREVR